MQSNPKKIKKNFQKSIDKYSENAVVQNIMAEKLVAAVKPKVFDNILELGAGAGVLTKKVSENFKYDRYYAKDLVEKSSIYVEKYVPQALFFAGDFRRINFKRSFNLIISNAVFQWFKNLDKIIEKCSGMLECDGVLAFSTFSPDNLREFREVSGLSLEYKSVDYIKNILEKDFEIISIESFDYQLKFDNPLKILAHMKNTGVNSLTDKSWSVKDVKIFCDNYNRMFPELTLTYSPIIIVCKKKQ